MKLLALLIASLAVLIGGTLNTAAHGSAQVAGLHRNAGSISLNRHAWTLTQIVNLAHALKGPGVMPLQAAGTGTPTATPGVTPTPTTSPYPDALSILQSAATALQGLKRSHFEEITDAAGTGTNNSTIHIDAKGDATCKGPAFKTTIKGTANVSGQKSSLNAQAVVIKNSAWIKDKSTKNVWKKVSASTVTNLVDNPLDCSSSSSSGTGTSTVQAKDPVDLGPDTVNGTAVWHIQISLIDTSSSQTATADYFIGQKDSLPYKELIAVQDPTNSLNETYTLLLTRFNEKLTIAKPKVGSK